MVTIKEIAEKTGVSRGTVDRVLHNRGRVDKNVAEKVLEVAKSLEYRPNKAGQALAAAGRNKKINIVMPSLSNPFFLDIKKGMETSRERNGFSLSYFHYSGYGESECLDALDRAISDKADALLVTLPDTEKIRKRLEEAPCPFACVNSALSSDKNLFYSGPDYVGKGKINAGLLSIASSLFVPRILFLRGSEEMRGHKEILSGFVSALEERGIEYSLSREIETKDDDEEAERVTRKALEEDRRINTVFIATSGISGALKAIGERKLLVFTSDDTREVCKAIESGKVKWTVSQEPFLQGFNAVEKMADYLISHITPQSFIARNIVKIKENIGEEICL